MCNFCQVILDLSYIRLSGVTLLKVILDLISYLAFSQKYTKYTCTLKSEVLKKQYVKNHGYIRLGFGD